MNKLTYALAALAISGAFHTASATNLVQNGDFLDNSVWTATAGPDAAFGLSGIPGPVSGDLAYFEGSAPYDSLSQTLATVAGTTYNWSFYTGGGGGDASNSDLQVLFGGNSVYDLNNGGSGFQNRHPIMNFISGTFTATSSATVLTVEGWNVTSIYLIGNIDVEAANSNANVPEPATLALLTLGLAGMAARRRLS